jgi:MFS family permease
MANHGDTTIAMDSEMGELGITPPKPDEKHDIDEIELAKERNEEFTPEEERRLVRKLDFWIVPLMMFTYFLQSYDKGIMSAATQFGFNTDLGLTVVTGYTKAGVAITNNQRYSNASMIFYIGYLVGTYPMMVSMSFLVERTIAYPKQYLSQRFSTSRVIAIAVFLWGVVLMATAGCTNYAGIVVQRFFLGFLESTVAPAFTVSSPKYPLLQLP